MAVRKENESNCSVSCAIVIKYLMMIFAMLTIKSGTKLIKTHLRTTMTEKRLEALMMLSCEKDLTDNANLDKIAESWAVLKSRKVKL